MIRRPAASLLFVALLALGSSISARTVEQNRTRSNRFDPQQPDTTRSKTPVDSTAKGRDTMVYVTRTGGKYHREGCRYLSKGAYAISLKQARDVYEPCSTCTPPK